MKSMLVIVAALLSLVAAAPAHAATIVNGDFETGDLTGWATFTTANGGIGPADVVAFDTSGRGASLSARFTVGQVSGQIGGGFPREGGGLVQNIDVPAGEYDVQADVATHGGFNADCGLFELLVDGTIVAAHDFGGCFAFDVYRARLAATVLLTAGSHEVRIRISRGYGVTSVTQYVDNVAVLGEDTTPPTLHLPGPITVEAPDDSGTAVSYSVSATDDQDPSPTVSCEPASGAFFAVGITTVTCTAADAAGNGASGSFDVTVLAPVVVTLTIDGVGLVNPVTGVATVRANVTCSRPTTVFVTVNLTQRAGRLLINGSGAAELACADTHSVPIDVVGENGLFVAGRADARGFATGAGEVQRTIQLRGGR